MQAKVFTEHLWASIKQDDAKSGSHLEPLKCTETYGTPSFEHAGCLNYTKFLNYKNEAVKSMCDLCRCAVLPARTRRVFV